jgi:hypothetical protein
MQTYNDVTVAILDDVPDANGTVWCKEVVRFDRRVPVTSGFDGNQVIGQATLRLDGTALKATLELSDYAIDDVNEVTPAVSGMVNKMTLRNDGNRVLDDITLKTVGLCDAPNSDPRVLSLGKQILRQTIKIFAMNDCDWYAGTTAEDATRGMAENLGFETTPEAIAEMCEEYTVKPVELSDEDLERKMFADDDEDGAKGSVERSFRAQLDNMIATGEEFPCFFASTEF